MSVELLGRLDAYAAKIGVSRSAALVKALSLGLP
jgi:hypothetical protein